MKKIALYIRVSTREQATEGYSIAAQNERLKNFCKAKDWTVFNIYEDGGYSGSNTKRPALSQLIEDAKHKRFDVVLVYKLDRLSRSQKDTLYLIEDVFLKHDVDFVSMNENFDTTSPFGRAMIGILSVFAQLEREQIKERMAMGMEERAKEGFYHGGGNHIPIGYEYVDSQLIINEYEAMQIRELFDLYLKGYGVGYIQRHLKSKYTTKNGDWSTATTVRNAIDKVLYIGKIKHKNKVFDGQHEPIISEEVFNKAQRISKSKQNKLNVNTQTPHLLGGMIWCERCGARYFRTQLTYVYKDKREPRYWYKCYSRHGGAHHMIKDPDCKNKNYRQFKLEAIVLNKIKEVAGNDQYLIEHQQAGIKSDSTDYKKQIRKIDEQIKRLLDLYQMGTVEYEEIDDRINKLNKEKETLSDAISEQTKDKLTAKEAKIFLNESADIIDNGAFEEKQQLITALIDYISIDGDEINLHFKF